MPLETIRSHGSTSNPARASAASGDGGAVEGRALELSAASWGSTGIERLRNQTAPEEFAIGCCEAACGVIRAKCKSAQRGSLQKPAVPASNCYTNLVSMSAEVGVKILWLRKVAPRLNLQAVLFQTLFKIWDP